MRLAALLIISILSVLKATAQSNFIPGFIVNIAGDTLKGVIDYRNWEKNPAKIAFKATENGSVDHYKPSQLIAFAVQGEMYIGAVVDMEVSPEKLADLDPFFDFRLKKDTAVFLQSLFDGDKSLFYFNPAIGKDQFYIREQGRIVLLPYKQYRKETPTGTLVVPNKKYLGQLSLYLKECNSIDKKLERTDYKKKELVQLFEEYFKCRSSTSKFARGKENAPIEFGVRGGYMVADLKFKGSPNHLSQSDFAFGNGFSAGIFLNIVMPRSHNKFSINNELSFTDYSISGTSYVYQNPTTFTDSKYNFGYSQAKVTTLFQYKRPIGTHALFFNLGLSNAIVIKEENSKIVSESYFSVKSTKERKALESTKNHELGYLIGSIGINVKKYDVQIRVERGNGMSDFPNLTSTTMKYQLLVGYKLR